MGRALGHPVVLFTVAGLAGMSVGLLTGSFIPWTLTGIGVGMMAAAVRRMMR